MGWKNIKEAYRIGHIVVVYKDKGICIGSPYVHDLLTITPDGEVKWGSLGPSTNEDLARYAVEMTADKAKLVELLNAPDSFSLCVDVYTYERGEIIKKLCEEPAWPNVTHDGILMHDNSYSTDKSLVVKWAKRNAMCGIEWKGRRIKEIGAQLDEMQMLLSESNADLAKLEADYPEVASS